MLRDKLSSAPSLRTCHPLERPLHSIWENLAPICPRPGCHSHWKGHLPCPCKFTVTPNVLRPTLAGGPEAVNPLRVGTMTNASPGCSLGPGPEQGLSKYLRSDWMCWNSDCQFCIPVPLLTGWEPTALSAPRFPHLCNPGNGRTHS